MVNSECVCADSFQLSNTPSLIPLPSYLTIPNLPPNLATLSTIGYSAFYILLEPIAGSLLAPLLLGSTAYWNHLTTVAPSPTNKIAAGVFVVSWLAQFVGHGAFEGRAPALLDNLVQALVLAPFFVWMELLFMLGYRPELKGRVDKAVAIEIEKYKKSKANGVAKNGTAK
jgi:uncharacterized membrane protein YGL010W